MKKENRTYKYDVSVFIAEDGSEFFNKQECTEHEEKTKRKNIIDKLPVKHICEDNDWYYCKELDMLNALLNEKFCRRELYQENSFVPDWFKLKEEYDSFHEDFCGIAISLTTYLKNLEFDIKEKQNIVDQLKSEFFKNLL